MNHLGLWLSLYLKRVQGLPFNYSFIDLNSRSPRTFLVCGLFIFVLFTATGCAKFSQAADVVFDPTVSPVIDISQGQPVPEKPTPENLLPTPLKTAVPTSIGYTPDIATPTPVSTITPQVDQENLWFTRPEFPPNPPLFAQVRNPDQVLMYGSLDEAIETSQAFYRFAYDLVYVYVQEIKNVGGADYARILFDGHDRWLKADVLEPVTISNFSGIILTEGKKVLQQGDSIALIVTDTVSMTGSPYKRGDVLLLDHVDEQTGILSLGGGEQINLDHAALIPLTIMGSEAGYPCRRIIVDVSSNTLAVYDDTCSLLFATLISTGILPGSTPLGKFRVAEKEVSHTFRAPPELRQTLGNYIFENVPYTMIFSGYFAIHSVYWHDSFGTSTSHGCVNLSISDAMWLFNWAEEQDWIFIQW